MSGRGDDRAARAIENALAAAPADILDILAAVREAMSGGVALREGAVHAVLHRLVRAGTVIPGGWSSRGLCLYGTSASEPTSDAEPSSPEPMPAQTARAAQRVASGVRDPADRGRLHRDVAAHWSALAAKEQLHRFGSTRSARSLLHRVDRGKRTVCIPEGAGGMAHRLLLHEGPWLLTAAVVFLLLKFFVVQPFVIPSESMTPTLLVDDRVAVFTLFESGVPDRWDIVVYRRGGTNYVKRLVGLPGESIAIVHGDIYIGGKLVVKPDDVREALRARVGQWDFSEDTPKGWIADQAHDERTWNWRSGAFTAHRSGGLGNSYALRDGYLVLEAERGKRGELILTLIRGPDLEGDGDAEALEWTLEVGVQGIKLEEQSYRDKDRVGQAELLAAVDVPPRPGRVTLELSYVDGVLRASCGSWRFKSVRQAPDAAMGVKIARRGVGAEPRRLTLDRDLHYAHLGNHGVPKVGMPVNPHPIPEGRIFLMGDNTTNSTDSRYREVGDISLEDVVGPVHVRIWPPARWGRVR